MALKEYVMTIDEFIDGIEERKLLVCNSLEEANGEQYVGNVAIVCALQEILIWLYKRKMAES